MLEHTPLTTSSFQGLYNRSDETKVPYDHLYDCLNLRFKDGQFQTREGSELDITLSGILRMHIFKKSNEAPRYLCLATGGIIYDAALNTITPILTITNMTDFSIAVMNDRCYITPHDGLVGLPGQFVYIYDGNGSARKAGGVGPVSPPTAATGSAGKVETGIHLFAIAFETQSGFVTSYGPTVLYDAPGAFKVLIGDIPVGLPGTIARHIVATKGLIEYNGDPNSVEFFFVPAGNIQDNTSTSKEVDFYDSELIATCDYVLEQLAEIPAGVALIPYNGRLCVVATNINPDTVLVSKRGSPESFNEVEGFFTKHDSQVNFRNGFEYRGLGYFGKSDRWYTVKDNDDEAITWDIPDADMAVGCECHTVARILDKDGNNIYDGVFVADRSGFYFYNGSFSGQPLSWKIDTLWSRINKVYFHTIEISIDTLLSCGYISVPLDNATSPSHILYLDFSKAISPQDVRWCLWQFPWAPTTIAVEINNITKKSVFKTASNNIYRMDESLHVDENQTIVSFARFAYVSSGESGAVNHFHGCRTRINGSGTVKLNVYTVNDVRVINPPGLVLNDIEEGYKDRIFNLITEKASVKLLHDQAGAWMRVTEFTLLAKVAWEMRPNP